MKIDQPYIPLVSAAPKANNTPQPNAVPVVQGRPKRREEPPKKKPSQQSKKNASTQPLFSSLVARELSSRLASEVHDHEDESEETNEEYADEDMTEEEFLALEAEIAGREVQMAPISSDESKDSE